MGTDSWFFPMQTKQFAVLPREERKQARALSRSFHKLPDDPGSYKNLREISDQAFPLEKRALRAVWQASSPPEVNVLFSTVGTTEKPVILTLLALRPQLAYLFHTDYSRRFAELVGRDPEVQGSGITILTRTITEADVSRNYRVIGGALEDARARLGGGCALSVDPTGGTKMMIAAAATWAFYHRVPLTYLYCPAKQRVAYPFAGEIKRVANPYLEFADIELDQIRRFAAKGFYDAALDLCRAVMRQVADLETAKRLELLENWLEICQLWDGFAHSHPNAGERPNLGQRLADLISQLQQYRLPDPDAEQRRRNLEFLQGLRRPAEGEMNVCDLHRLADIWAQAERRAGQGKYDDAVARLYRITEMALAVRLSEHGLKATDRPCWAKMQKQVGKSYEQLCQKVEALPADEAGKKPSLPREYLGLANLAALLAALDPAFRRGSYAAIRAKLGEGGVFHRRNRSVLAHGTLPLTKEDYRRAEREIRFILRSVLGEAAYAEVENLLAAARHALPPI